jgi:hypothetical protein
MSSPEFTTESVTNMSADHFVHGLRIKWKEVERGTLIALFKNLFYTPYKHPSLIDEFVGLLNKNNIPELSGFLEKNAITTLEDQLEKAGKRVIKKDYDKILSFYLDISDEGIAFNILQGLLVSGYTEEAKFNLLLDAMIRINGEGNLKYFTDVNYNAFHM